MSLLLCFSGQIGSGKSSVSTAVATALGWKRVGFGDYLRSEIAKIGGDPNDRKALQDLGQQRVATDAMAFCRDVLTAVEFVPGEDIVVDGVRHVTIFEVLDQISKPSRARLLFLGVPEDTRYTRIQSRADAPDFVRASVHQVEVEAQDALPKRADALVDAGQSFDEVVSDCLGWARRWRDE